MYNDRYNNPNAMSPGYGMPYRMPQPPRVDPYRANPTRMAQPQYGGGQINSPEQEYAQPVTDGEQTPPWQGFGVRPYWANSTYLYGGMGGLRPGMPQPYRPRPYEQAPTNSAPTNVVNANDMAAQGYSTSAEYLAAKYGDYWNANGTPRGATGAYGQSGPVNARGVPNNWWLNYSNVGGR